ncbi:hypothetical protein [Citrobacter braakii]|uniref:hypothetical protein n=1 Tax=Citrobacter braakii TaxID=57706 RepID=UPI0039909587
MIRCVCGKKIGPDPRNFNQRVSLGRNDLLIRTFLKGKKLTSEERRKVLCIAREQIRSQRRAEEIKKERDKERHAVMFEWKRPETFRR